MRTSPCTPYLLALQPLLTEEERLTWRNAADFMRDRVEPVIIEAYEHARFPHQLIHELARMGFLGASTPPAARAPSWEAMASWASST